MTRQRLRSLDSMLSLWVQAFLIPHLAERDNVRIHRAGTSDCPFLKHAQVRLRVQCIVILPIAAMFVGVSFCVVKSLYNLAFYT